MRVLSGIQPSGRLHLGNYFGAIKQYLELQHEHEAFYFIANYHAMTTLQEAEALANARLRDFEPLRLFSRPGDREEYLERDLAELRQAGWEI